MMNPNIQSALQHLQNANLSGYFEEMDKVVPDAMRYTFNTLKGIFIAGKAPWDFYQQLEVFAKSLANQPNHQEDVKKLPKTYPQTLSGKQKEDFCEALIAAYLNRENLEQFSSFKMDIPLDTITGGKNLKVVVFDLVNHCEANGLLAKLIKEVEEDKGNNPRLKKFLESLS